MTDLVLAILHHLLVFSMFAIFAVQMALVRPGLDAAGVARLARFDAAYGAIAVVVLVVGFSRAFFGIRGWEYYAGYWVFWAKVAAFLAGGLLSVPPTMRFRRWRRAAQAETGYAVPAAEIALVRSWLHGQGFVLLLILVLAAMLARAVLY